MASAQIVAGVGDFAVFGNELLGVPPWQRNRIPLIFYGETLQSAVGFFRVFHEKMEV